MVQLRICHKKNSSYLFNYSHFPLNHGFMAETVDNLNRSPFSRHVWLPNCNHCNQSTLEVGKATQENSRDEISINNHPTNKNHEADIGTNQKTAPNHLKSEIPWQLSLVRAFGVCWQTFPTPHKQKNLQPHFEKKQNHSCVLNGKIINPSTKQPLKTLPLKTFHGSHPTSHHLIPFPNSQRSHPIPATPQRPYVARSWSSQRVATWGGRGIHWEHLVITSNRGYLKKDGWTSCSTKHQVFKKLGFQT